MQRKDVTPNSDKKVYCKIWDWFMAAYLVVLLF